MATGGQPARVAGRTALAPVPSGGLDTELRTRLLRHLRSCLGAPPTRWPVAVHDAGGSAWRTDDRALSEGLLLPVRRQCRTWRGSAAPCRGSRALPDAVPVSVPAPVAGSRRPLPAAIPYRDHPDRAGTRLAGSAGGPCLPRARHRLRGGGGR